MNISKTFASLFTTTQKEASQHTNNQKAPLIALDSQETSSVKKNPWKQLKSFGNRTQAELRKQADKYGFSSKNPRGSIGSPMYGPLREPSKKPMAPQRHSQSSSLMDMSVEELGSHLQASRSDNTSRTSSIMLGNGLKFFQRRSSRASVDSGYGSGTETGLKSQQPSDARKASASSSVQESASAKPIFRRTYSGEVEAQGSKYASPTSRLLFNVNFSQKEVSDVLKGWQKKHGEPMSALQLINSFDFSCRQEGHGYASDDDDGKVVNARMLSQYPDLIRSLQQDINKFSR
jgi:hypothetical protein